MASDHGPSDRPLRVVAVDLGATSGRVMVGRVGADLLLYRRGTLQVAPAPEILELGLFDSWLPPQVHLAFSSGDALEEVDRRRLALARNWPLLAAVVALPAGVSGVLLVVVAAYRLLQRLGREVERD